MVLPDAVNEFIDLLVRESEDIARAERFKTKGFGDVLRLSFPLSSTSPPRKQILAIGHSDTVWPLGTLASMPVRQSKGRLWGPGVLDMKSGLAFFLTALRIVKDLAVPLTREIVLLVVPDEEVGSPESRAADRTGSGKRAMLFWYWSRGQGLPGN